MDEGHAHWLERLLYLLSLDKSASLGEGGLHLTRSTPACPKSRMFSYCRAISFFSFRAKQKLFVGICFSPGVVEHSDHQPWWIPPTACPPPCRKRAGPASANQPPCSRRFPAHRLATMTGRKSSRVLSRFPFGTFPSFLFLTLHLCRSSRSVLVSAARIESPLENRHHKHSVIGTGSLGMGPRRLIAC